MHLSRHFLGLAIVLLVGLTSCKEEAKKVIKTTPVTFTKEGSLKIFKQENDSLISSLDIEIAESDYETQTGLMYRKGMETNQGMLFIFPDVAMHSFYMKNTEFPLDILFIDEDLKVASIQKNAQPFNENGLSSKVPVKYVLEVNAGLSDTWSIEVGDRISFERL
ncbi:MULTISPECIES: DUF192 domain-containing protein [Maribacter]|uniref:DUF192 domain-containing protein n=2 Tax=Maribacter TaxID=252356 RepID=A0A5B2TXG0_9FLAO|nr:MULTISPECIES: DUF192 domain-containing protein [Maribacter]KAA2218330.1 DUF192 domain-containing protein [Maribacter flavus]MDC6404980.1 DUF192 domain-containing protein [Maribacter sp. PR66]MEE1972394.1 DUF192 domain-containing protein [Maribacter flavus]TLF45603.1 DUF192 domain-containing protein [Maribacter aurantiacus]